jgi:hypothetical protein
MKWLAITVALFAALSALGVANDALQRIERLCIKVGQRAC